MKQDFEVVLKEIARWNEQGWNKEQTHIGIALFNLFVSNLKDVKEQWDVSESLESFHKSFRQVPVTSSVLVDSSIWNLISISGHFWNSAMGNEPDFGEDVLDPSKE